MVKENHLVLPITKIFCFQPTVVFYFNSFFNDFQLNCVEIFLILHILLEKKLHINEWNMRSHYRKDFFSLKTSVLDIVFYSQHKLHNLNGDPRTLN